MMIAKKVSERLVRAIPKFQTVLKIAKDRDVNEADTVSIIKDMLSEIFGYDKYIEITSEFQIRGTFCDLAIKIDGKVEFLIEAKAIGLELKDGHLKQAIDYGANQGIQWVILTNGITWKIYKIRFEQPINYDLISKIDFSIADVKNPDLLERIFILCKEGLTKAAREEYHERLLVVNRFVIGALLLQDDVINVIRRELRRFSEGVLVSPEEILKVLTTEVIKRDVLEGDDATKTQALIRKFYGKGARKLRTDKPEVKDTAETKEAKDTGLSLSDQLLQEAGIEPTGDSQTGETGETH